MRQNKDFRLPEGVQLRTMEEGDFAEVHALWMQINGFAIRSIDDSKKGVLRFIKRNPTTSIVAEADGRIVGPFSRARWQTGMLLSCLRGRGLPQARHRKSHGNDLYAASAGGGHQ